MAYVRTSTEIYDPRAEDMTLLRADSRDGHIIFKVAANDVWIALGIRHSDREAEAVAMDRLSALAAEAAALLRAGGDQAGRADQ